MTERDIVGSAITKEFEATKSRVGEIMSSPILTIGPDAAVQEAMGMMNQKKI